MIFDSIKKYYNDIDYVKITIGLLICNIGFIRYYDNDLFSLTVDGKDYGVSGTFFDGKAYFWDVTDPTNITKTDSIKVDARIVNDVKVSKDSKICEHDRILIFLKLEVFSMIYPGRSCSRR